MTTAPERLARELAELRRRLIALERGGQLSHSSIQVDGEAMPVSEALGAGIGASKDLVDVKDELDLAGEALVEQKRRLDEDIPILINEAAASPVTDARLQAGSLTTWPFEAGVVPAGALTPGAVGAMELADFSVVARKFKDDRHRIY